MVTGYYIKEAAGLRRDEIIITIDGSKTDTIVEHVDWIKPINTTQNDIPTPVWGTLHQAVATAMAKKYTGPTRTAFLPAPVNYAGNPAIGAARYWYDQGADAKIHFSVAINFDPGSQGSID